MKRILVVLSFCAAPAFANSTASVSLNSLSVALTSLDGSTPSLTLHSSFFSRRVDATGGNIFNGGYNVGSASASSVDPFGQANGSVCCVDLNGSLPSTMFANSAAQDSGLHINTIMSGEARALIEFILSPHASAAFTATVLESVANSAVNDVAIAWAEMQLGGDVPFQDAMDRNQILRTPGSNTRNATLSLIALNTTAAPVIFGFFIGLDSHTESGTFVAAIPEPATYAMLLMGLGLIGWRMLSFRHAYRFLPL